MAAYSTSAAKTLEAPGLKERIDGLDQTLKAHVSITEQYRAYLSAQFSAKPGEEQTLLAHFRRLEAEILKLGAAPLNPMAAGEVKSMLQDFETHMANKHGDAVTKQMGDSGNMLSMAVAADDGAARQGERAPHEHRGAPQGRGHGDHVDEGRLLARARPLESSSPTRILQPQLEGRPRRP